MIAVDCEMSGLDPRVNAILSIGAIDTENKSRRFYGECRMSDGKVADAVALSINGFREKDLQNPEKQTLKELMQDFYNWTMETSDRTLLGQNVFLDKEFLNIAFEEVGIPFCFHYRVVDIHSVACSMFLKYGVPIVVEDGKMRMSLDKISEILGMPREPRPHNGLNGAMYNAEIFYRLVHEENFLPEFQDCPIKNFML